MIRWATILLAVVGLGVGLYAVSRADQPVPDVPLARPASVSPFERGVAALGVVEPGSRSVPLSAPEAGLVTEVLAEVGERVEAGAPLFRLDDRTVRAELIRAQAAVDAAQADLARWQALPRAEDLPPLEAAVESARASLADAQEQYDRTRAVAREGAAVTREVSSALNALNVARAQVARAEADLSRARAGGWTADRDVLLSTVASRRAEVEALRLLQDRLTVRAPRAGVVLRRDVEPGQLAALDQSRPAMILGDLASLRVRAQVDEEDIALVGAGARAVAITRGAVQRRVPLTLVRIEPFARPKTDLSGANTERTDTRVIDVLFDVTQAPTPPLYPGQAVDVFIEGAN